MELYRAYGSDGTEKLCMCRNGRYRLCALSPNNATVRVCICTGVFVMVTMAVSTVSVIESVIVIRLCSPQLTVKPLPPVVRLVAFRLGRLLCVSCPSTKLNTGSSRVRPTVTVDDSHSSPDVQRDSETADGTGKPTRPRTSLDDVLFELRKVNSLLVQRPRRDK